MKADTVDAGQFSISSLARSNVHNVASSNNPLTRPSVKPIVQPARRRRVGWTATTKDTTIASSDSTTPVATTALAAEGRRWSPRGSARTSTIRTPAPCRRANLDWRRCVRSDRVACERQVERALLDVGDEHRVEIGLQVARALLDRLGELVQSDPTARPVDPASVRHAILRRRPDRPGRWPWSSRVGGGTRTPRSGVGSVCGWCRLPPVNDSFSASRRVVMSGSRWFISFADKLLTNRGQATPPPTGRSCRPPAMGRA